MTQRANSVMSMDAVSEAEMEHMRLAVVEREGLLQDIFRMLRSVPRRILIVIKLNDLTRSLDKSLETTHDQVQPPPPPLRLSATVTPLFNRRPLLLPLNLPLRTLPPLPTLALRRLLLLPPPRLAPLVVAVQDQERCVSSPSPTLTFCSSLASSQLMAFLVVFLVSLRLVEIWQDGKGMWVKWKQDGGLWKKEAGGKVREAAAAAAVATSGAEDVGRLALAV
jgi:hypothetical protein